jgi:PAS domain S-box-containing protein
MTLDFDLMRRLVENLRVGICVLDRDDKIVVFNRKVAEQLKQEETRVDSSILRCHPERAEPGVLKMISELKSGELEKYEGWVHFIGEFFYEYIYAIRDNQGNHLATVMELHDAHERAEYLRMTEGWKPPPEHGRGASSPRSPFPWTK